MLRFRHRAFFTPLRAPKYEEMLRLRRILDMEEMEIMDTIYSIFKGAAIDEETYFDRLTGHKRLRTE